MIPHRYTDDEPSFRERLAIAIANAFEKFSRIGQALVWPIEHFFAWLGSLLFRGIDATESSDSLLSKVLHYLGAPVRAIVYAFERISTRLHIEPFVQPFRTAASWVSWILLYPFAVLFGFFTIFFSTRSRRFVWLAIPIMTIAIALGYVVYSVSIQDKPHITARYQKALDKALEQQDFATAGLYQQKLQQLGAAVDRFDLRKADELLKKGEVEEAFALVKGLAPTEKLGLPAAHFWLAVHYLGQADFDQNKLKIAVEERCEIALEHLDLLKDAKIESIETIVLRSLAYSVLGNFDQAKETLLVTRDQNLTAALLRFQLSLQSKDAKAAKEDAEAVSKLLRESSELHLSADSKTLQLWFVAEMMRQNNIETEKVAEIWYRRFPEDEGAKNSLVALRLAKFDRRFEVASTVEFPELASLFIDTALLQGDELTDPFKFRILRLFEASKLGDRKATELLSGMQETQFNASLAEFFGTAAASIQDFAAARRYLEKAVQLKPNYQVAWNNLAYALDHGFPNEYTRSLEAATKAIELKPDDVHALDTRASIYMRLNRFDEAKADVKKMLELDPTLDSALKLQAKLTEADCP